MAQWKNSFRRRKQKFYISPIYPLLQSQFCPLYTLKKKKILCPHKLGYSDIYKAQSPQSGFVRWVGNQGS